MHKLFYLFIFVFSISLKINSQIIITSDEIVGVGDEVIQGFNTEPPATIEPGEAGEDKTWDFTDLNVMERDTFNFLTPLNTPYWEKFPGSNLALYMKKDFNYVYFDKNEDSLSMLGIVIKVEELGRVDSKVKPPEEFMKFPYEYGYANDEVFNYVFVADGSAYSVDSVILKRITEKSSEVDAWGTMSVPMGTYEVLRVHETRDIKDSIWGKLPFIGWQFLTVEESSEERYLWWSDDPEVGYVLVNLNIDVENGNVTSAEFMAEPVHVGKPETFTSGGINVYPNPVKDYLRIRTQDNKNKSFFLFNVAGELVLSKKISSFQENIYLGFLDKGLYIYKIHNSHSSETGKIIRQ